MADDKAPDKAAGTIYVWSESGGVTAMNWDEMPPDQRENIAGRLRSGELRKASGPDDKPDAPDEIPETRIARAAVPQAAGSSMAPRQGVDVDHAQAQGLDDNAGDVIKAEHEALTELGDDASTTEKLAAKQDAGAVARTEAADVGLRGTARARKSAASKP